MAEVGQNLERVCERMVAACHLAGREPSSVCLIAVSKTFPAESIQEAIDSGQAEFGESKLQEAEPKIISLPVGPRWHFIGRVQRNKVRKILPLFPVIHAIDSVRLAVYMDSIAGELEIVPEIFLQVNIGGEESKGGFSPKELEAGIQEIGALNHVRIAGLMAIPPEGDQAEESRIWFRRLRELRDHVESVSGMRLPGLSMGMSGDYEVAIAEGATHVRVGSSIFGKRTYRLDGELG